MELLYKDFVKQESSLAKQFQYACFCKVDLPSTERVFLSNDITSFTKKNYPDARTVFKANQVTKSLWDFNEKVQEFK